MRTGRPRIGFNVPGMNRAGHRINRTTVRVAGVATVALATLVASGCAGGEAVTPPLAVGVPETVELGEFPEPPTDASTPPTPPSPTGTGAATTTTEPEVEPIAAPIGDSVSGNRVLLIGDSISIDRYVGNDDWSDIPFMFLSSDGSIESKIRGLELGVQDYLTKPIYIREVIARVGIELARQARAGLALKSTDARTRFSGSLSEMSVVDLLQTIDVSRKSGVLTLIASDGQEGMISFDSGAVINATVEDLRGEDAIYRQLLWREGSFDLEFRRVSLSERTVHRTTQALLMEGMRRLDEWSRLSELLPPFDTVLEVDAEMLRERLRDMPDEQNDMVRLIDGERAVGEVLLAHGGDHVEALRKVVDLYFEGMVREVGRVQDSIPILAEAFVHSSAPPPKEGVNTIPGPGVRGAGEVSTTPDPELPRTDVALVIGADAAPKGFFAPTAVSMKSNNGSIPLRPMLRPSSPWRAYPCRS